MLVETERGWELEDTTDPTRHFAAIEYCRREIVVIESQIRGGHPDIEGLCLALADWSAELRLFGGERYR